VLRAILSLVLLTDSSLFLSFFSRPTSTTEIYTLSLHDALPISSLPLIKERILVIILLLNRSSDLKSAADKGKDTRDYLAAAYLRSEERFSRNAETDLVCRLLLEKKKEKRAIIELSHTYAHVT